MINSQADALEKQVEPDYFQLLVRYDPVVQKNISDCSPILSIGDRSTELRILSATINYADLRAKALAVNLEVMNIIEGGKPYPRVLDHDVWRDKTMADYEAYNAAHEGNPDYPDGRVLDNDLLGVVACLAIPSLRLLLKGEGMKSRALQPESAEVELLSKPGTVSAACADGPKVGLSFTKPTQRAPPCPTCTSLTTRSSSTNSR